MFIVPSWIIPLWIVVGEHLYPLGWWTGTYTSPMSHFGHSALHQFPPDVIVAQLEVSELLHSHMVSTSTQSPTVAARFLGKHGTYCLTLGWAVDCWMLAGMIAGYWVSWWIWVVVLMPGYWKCLATVAPHLVPCFVTVFSLLCTVPTELKTQTLSTRCL